MSDIEEKKTLSEPVPAPNERQSTPVSKKEKKSWGPSVAALLFWLAIAYALVCTWRIAKLTRTTQNTETSIDKSELEVLSTDPLKIKFAHGSIVGSIDNGTGISS